MTTGGKEVENEVGILLGHAYAILDAKEVKIKSMFI